MAASKVISAIYATAKAKKEEHDGAAIMASKDVAKIIKIKLAEKFPGVKFSVKSDYNCVDVYWNDGPHRLFVEAIIKKYSFGGFDGMIDMAYSSKNWLFPNGDMVPASCDGTQGSRGRVESFATDCPIPGAVLVKFGPNYVFAHHHVSDELWAVLIAKVAFDYGYEIDPNIPIHQQVVSGEYLTTLAYRVACDEARGALEAEKAAAC